MGAVAKSAPKSLLSKTTSELSVSSQSTVRSNFLRDRIARRKELEEAEFGKEESEDTIDKGSQSKDELTALVNEEKCGNFVSFALVGFTSSFTFLVLQILDCSENLMC